jgi:NAD(P)-dependent dehydrogenase (short-subunit alcohol dehydrogenase family)
VTERGGPGDLSGRVAVVTGAGGGIGAAVAMELARRGASVVVNDLGVNPLGTAAGDSSAEATVARIVEEGGTAVADTSSVTDADAVERMVRRAVDDLGSVDILVNPAGVVPSGRLDDIDQAAWDRLLGVHVGGHINTVNAVLPHMERQGYGRILNVTSGAGLQRVAAETAVYGTAKRAISALTVALARRAPAGVTINALSPIALTRMVAGPAQAAAASRGASGGPPGYGLDFGNMPAPEALAPVVAYLCGDGVDWLNGRIVFTNGQEASVIVPPRLIEAVHASAWARADGDMGDALASVLAPAARAGATTGGSMPRVVARATSPKADPGTQACVVVWTEATAGEAVVNAFRAQGWKVVGVDMTTAPSTRPIPSAAANFDGAAASWLATEAQFGGLDAVVVVTGGNVSAEASVPMWRDVALSDLRVHSAWSRAAVTACKAPAARQVSLVNVVSVAATVDAVIAAGVAQLTRCLQVTPDTEGLRCFSIEHQPHSGPALLAELAERLCHHEEAGDLVAGDLVASDLVAGEDWIGLRAHPAAGFTASFGDAGATAWIDSVLRGAVEVAGERLPLRS